jgi:hypothetical protein
MTKLSPRQSKVAGYSAPASRTGSALRSGRAQGLAVATAIALVLVGFLSLARLSRQQIRDWDRYTVLFGDIDCVPPEGQERREFLGEVQYLAGFPEHLRLLDERLPARLAEGFAKHPRVKRVISAEILPNRKIRIGLVYR